MKAHTKELSRRSACGPAVRFADQHASLQKAWEACKDNSWMIWLLTRCDSETAVVPECDCISLSLGECSFTKFENRPPAWFKRRFRVVLLKKSVPHDFGPTRFRAIKIKR